MKLLTVIAVLLLASSLRAHSVHQSTAEMEFNAATKRLEVSLTVFVNDLELALIRESERRMFIDTTPAAEFDAQLVKYLTKTFVVTRADGTAAEMTWVGRERDAGSAKSDDPAVTLFFEIALPDGLEGASLHNTVFDALFPDETNFVLLRAGAVKQQFQFKRGDKARTLAPGR